MKSIDTMIVAFLATLAVTGATSALAQTGTSDQAVSQVEDVVVTARRAGLPIWQVTRGGSTVILAGAVSGVPRDYRWRPEALEAATRRSQRILYPQVGRASAADVLRLIWRMRTISRLPEGRTSADYLSPELEARLERVMAAERSDDWHRQSFVLLGLDLLEKGGFEREGRAVADVVRRAARDTRIPGEPVGVVRGDELVEKLISQPPGAYVACIQEAVGAAEAGPEGATERLDAWTGLRVAEAIGTPLDRALNQCWPSGDPDVAPLLRTQWTQAVGQALDQPGVTLGVVSLRILAEPGGVLDQLRAQGLEVEGPDWRAD